MNISWIVLAPSIFGQMNYTRKPRLFSFGIRQLSQKLAASIAYLACLLLIPLAVWVAISKFGLLFPIVICNIGRLDFF